MWCHYTSVWPLLSSRLNQIVSLNFNLTINERHTRTHGHTGGLCSYPFAPTHMPVRGNGAHGGGSVVHYHKDNLLQACVLCRVMKRNPAAVSYHCTIGNMKSRQEAELKLRARVADDFVFGLIYVFFCFTSFEASPAARRNNSFCHLSWPRNPKKDLELWGRRAKVAQAERHSFPVKYRSASAPDRRILIYPARADCSLLPLFLVPRDLFFPRRDKKEN